MRDDNEAQAKAIREHQEQRQPASNETAKQARLRTQIEQQAKKTPMTGVK